MLRENETGGKWNQRLVYNELKIIITSNNAKTIINKLKNNFYPYIENFIFDLKSIWNEKGTRPTLY